MDTNQPLAPIHVSDRPVGIAEPGEHVHLRFIVLVEGNFLDRSMNPVIGSGERSRCPPC